MITNKLLRAKLANWRWWVTLPVTVALLAVITPFIILQFVFGVMADLLNSLSDAFDFSRVISPRWFTRMIKWSDENDKV